jgi:phage gp36-like protein
MARATPSYATPDDLAIFGVPNAVIDSLTVAEKARYLAAASDRADGLIQNHHTLPLVAWGDDLREAVCSIAVWSIMSRRVGLNPEQGADLAIRKNYEDAMGLLKMVAEGDVELAGVIDSTPPEDDGGAFVYSDAPRGWQ